MSRKTMVSEATPKERQDALFEALLVRPSMTVQEAWEFGHAHGFYQGGDGGKTKSDLEALLQRHRGRVRRHDGFWRHINEPDHIRTRYKRWADYWTAR